MSDLCPLAASRRRGPSKTSAICTDDNGLAVFELIRRARHGDKAVLCAFDLIELDGQDLRRLPVEQRTTKARPVGARSSSRHYAQRTLRR